MNLKPTILSTLPHEDLRYILDDLEIDGVDPPWAAGRCTKRRKSLTANEDGILSRDSRLDRRLLVFSAQVD